MTNFARAVARASVLSLAAFAELGCATGGGVAHDDAEAVPRFRLAAEQGEAPAQYELGLAYVSGRGVAQDDTEAVRWFQLAAEQGHGPAHYQLGLAYVSGCGVPQDDAEAVPWFQLAAEQGHAPGAVPARLGVCHRSRCGAGLCTSPHVVQPRGVTNAAQ